MKKKRKGMAYEEFEGFTDRENSDQQYWEFEEAYNHESDDTDEHFYGDFG